MEAQGGQDEKADISSLLEVNRLDYRLPPSLSIATSRSMKVYKSMESSYIAGSAQMQFTLSSGATYVDFLNSFLRFKVKMPNNTVGNPKMPAHCGWAQLIRQIRIVHSSGVEIDRTKDSVGEWIQIQNYYDRSEACRRTQGSLYSLNDTARASSLTMSGNTITRAKEGLNVSDAESKTNTTPLGDYLPSDANEAFYIDGDVSNREFDVCIPLAHLAGFFNVDLLALSFLAAGLQVHIDFYKPDHFFVTSTGNNGIPITPTMLNPAIPWQGDLKIISPEMHLETFTLTDSILRKLSQISSSSGLEWYFDAVHQMNHTVGESDLSMQITRALSRANNVIVKSRNAKYLGNSLVDSYASQSWVLPTEEGGIQEDVKQDGTLVEFQVQLGAQYIPSRSLQTKKEVLHSSLKTFSQFRRSDEVGGVDDSQFSGIRTNLATETEGVYLSGLAVAAVPLESSSTLQQSGAAISAQRTAVVNMKWKGEAAQVSDYGLRRVDAFVVYSKLCTLFLDSVVVRS